MSNRRSRSPLVPVAAVIATAALTSLFVVKMFGMPDAVAQTAPPAQIEPVQAGSNAAPAPTPVPTATAGSAPASTADAAGSGSAAATAGAGSGSGSAAVVAAPAAPTMVGGKPCAADKAWYDCKADLTIQEEGNFWFPKAVNKNAVESDQMYLATLGLSAFFFFAIAGIVIYFTIKYRHRPGHKAEPSPSHHDAMEITWTVIPTIIVVFLFYYGWRGYINLVTPPQKAVEVNVVAWQWAWEFTHSNGTQDSDLHVPVNTPVRLVMTSRDVLHSFYVPVMRTKQDIIPRRYTYSWFEATKPGTYRIVCAEYCGTDHSQMGRKPNNGRRTVIVVHEPGDYERYLADKASSGGGPPEKVGAIVYEKKGCAGCHSINGTRIVGPTFKGTFGTTLDLAEGPTLMDENYIRESLIAPSAKGRKDYDRSMPSFAGNLKEKEIEGIIAFIKSLK